MVRQPPTLASLPIWEPFASKRTLPQNEERPLPLLRQNGKSNEGWKERVDAQAGVYSPIQVTNERPLKTTTESSRASLLT